MALTSGAAALRYLPEWRRGYSDHACPTARTTTDARASHESQYPAHHGCASAWRFPGQWLDRLDWWPIHGDYQRSHCWRLLALSACRAPGYSHAAAVNCGRQI